MVDCETLSISTVFMGVGRPFFFSRSVTDSTTPLLLCSCLMLLILRRLCWLGVVLALGSELDEHLGDSITSEQSEDELFSVIDINGNGRISEAELFEVSMHSLALCLKNFFLIVCRVFLSVCSRNWW